ncbi:MAG: DoxX family protein [Prevotella sp.]|nr:DoxX family protein [Prevotella sp.]
MRLLHTLTVNLCRMVLALTFVFSGFVKAVDPMGTQYKIADYMAAWGMAGWLPSWATLAVAVGMAAVEFCLGLWLLFAIRRRMVSRLLLLIMLAMTPLTLWLALDDPIHDCGCFGDAVVLTNWQTFGKNMVLLTAAAVVAAWPTRMPRFISQNLQWIVTHYSALFILLVSAYSLYYLPLFDFRPYHICTDIRQALAQRWDTVGSPYTDFEIERADNGENITDMVATDRGYTMLLVAPQLETADDSRPDLLNRLYEYALEHDYHFFCLTASGQEAQQRWRDMTGAEYPFCQTDPIVLKTMIRSNPGLLLLHDGTIIRKWSNNDLPGEESLTKPLAASRMGQLPDNSVARRISYILMWFVLPLALLVIADRLWLWTRWVRRHKKRERKNIKH